METRPPLHPSSTVPVTKIVEISSSRESMDLSNSWMLAAIVGGILVLYSLSRIISMQRRLRDLEARPPVDDIVMRGMIRHEVNEIVGELETSLRAKEAFSKHSSAPLKQKAADSPVWPQPEKPHSVPAVVHSDLLEKKEEVKSVSASTTTTATTTAETTQTAPDSLKNDLNLKPDDYFLDSRKIDSKEVYSREETLDSDASLPELIVELPTLPKKKKSSKKKL